ncbi:hypothetical protein BS78_02G197300 [Paspalum vaginatum]|nr:hypothetical protein BS78_02G197300 [Paspalum vaginatum]
MVFSALWWMAMPVCKASIQYMKGSPGLKERTILSVVQHHLCRTEMTKSAVPTESQNWLIR